jgi:hypothetical protein
MSTHSQTTVLFYEFLRDELTLNERLRVEEHCAVCHRCRQELEELRALLSLMPPATPADERPPQYWQSFAVAVEERLETPRRRFWAELWDEIVSYLTLRPALATSLSGAVAVAILGIVLWQRYQPAHTSQSEAAPPSVEIPARTASTDARMSQYFRKSKMLLIGISNMKMDENAPVDLGAERKVSRDLLHEARYLKTQPMSGRSERLIGDLERILIELANLKDQGDAPEVEMIRGGIHQENLLFKIRAAESVYDSTRFRQTKAH